MNTKTIGSLFIASSILFGSVFSCSTNSNAVRAEEPNKVVFDYSTSASKITVNADVILKKLLEAKGKASSLSNAEIEYINSLYEFRFDGASNKAYKVAQIDNCYVVEAFSDSNYYPSFVLTNSGEYSFARLRDQYIACVPLSESDGARIIYAHWGEITAEDANSILNAAYPVASEQYAQRKYVADLQYYNEHVGDLEDYQNYLKEKAQYDLEKANYDAYLSAKAKYDSAKAKYDAYLAKQAKYIEQLAKYNDYLKDLETYSKNYPVFMEILERYEHDIAIVDNQLAKMDVLFKKFGSLQRTIHDFINSDSVDTVIAGKNKIIAAGVDARAVETAGYNATKAREYINNYYKLLSASKEERYSWYKLNYSRLLGYVTRLTQCLEYFYTFSLVRSAIKEKGKTEKYVLFVAELMYFCDLISDKPVRSYNDTYNLDKNREIGGKDGVYSSYLGKGLLDESLVAEPLSSVYPVDPAISIPGFVKPTEVTKPNAPEEVARPIEPEEVSEPTVPEEVANPGDIVLPTDPGYVIDTSFDALADAFGDGSIALRDETNKAISICVNDEQEINFETSQKAVVLFTNASPTVNFKEVIFSNSTPVIPGGDYCGFASQGIVTGFDNSLLGDKSINDVISLYLASDKKTKVNYSYYYEGPEGALISAEKEPGTIDVTNFVYPSEVDGLDISIPDFEDVINEVTYEFNFDSFDYVVSYNETENSLWNLSGSNQYCSEVDLKIIFKRNNKSSSVTHTIQFQVGAEIIDSQTVKSGEYPVAPANITRDPLGNTYYTFSGWDTTISEATSDKIYIAQFEGHQIIEDASFEGSNENLLIKVNRSISSVNIERFLNLVKEGKINANKFTFFFKDGNVCFDKNEVVYLANMGAKTLSLSVIRNENDIAVEPIILDGHFQKVTSSSLVLEVEVNNVSDPVNARVFVGEKEIAHEIKDDSNLIFELKLGNVATVNYFYKVTFDETINNINLKLNGEEVYFGASYEFKKGDEINIVATAKDGMDLTSIYCTDKHGQTNVPTNNRITVTSDVVIGASVEYIVYVVNFYVDDVIFQSVRTTYGSLISVPENIKKPSTDSENYVFINWDKNVTYVYEDMDIHAVFQTVTNDELSDGKKEVTGGLTQGQKLSIGILAFVVGGVVVTLIIVATKSHKKPQEEWLWKRKESLTGY